MRQDRPPGNALAQLAFLCDLLIRLRLIVDAIFELAVPLGQQPGYDVQAGRYAIALGRKLHRLPYLELVPV